jgi:hypothetical protein
LSNFRLAYNNFGLDDAAVVTASSALGSFPASYAVDEYRSKKWKPSGSFRIDATNNKIYINDSTDKTVTLTNAIYATGTALASHIQTQLNASSTNWTCTYSTTTGIFTINRTSGTEVLKLTTTTNAAWDTLGYIGVVDQNAAAADVRRNHTSERLTIDLGVTRAVQFFAVYQSPDSQFSISDVAVCKIRANSIDDYDSAPLSVTVTATYEGIYNFWTTAQSYRYWYFDFIDRENTDGPESFSLKVWIGDYVSPASRNIANGFDISLVDPSIIRRSENGIKYYNRKTKYIRINSLSIEWVNEADRDLLREVFNYSGTTKSLFVAVDPDALVSNVNEFTRLVTFDEDPSMPHLRYNYYGFRFSFSEVIG